MSAAGFWSRALLCIIMFAGVIKPAAAQPAQYMQIGGEVVTMNGAPIPGCAVRLLNADIGNSDPVETGPDGEYYFPEVPTNVNSLYDIQVWWGNQVIYNGVVPHPGIQAPIVIQVP